MRLEWHAMHKMLDMHMHEMHVCRMKLDQYLSATKMTDAAFAAVVGMSQSQVNRLRRGLSRPSWDAVATIERATEGKVRASDFLPSPSEKESA